MNYRLALTERVTADIVNAFKWHESQRNGLGRRFVVALNTAFANDVWPRVKALPPQWWWNQDPPTAPAKK